MKPEYSNESGEYYFFHSFVGRYPPEHFAAINQGENQWKEGWDVFKIRNFLRGPDNVGEMEEHIGLPYREIMCTLSQIHDAVTYYLPYGLILTGDIKTCFNDDSTLKISDNGTYEGERVYIAKNVTVEELANAYAEKYRSGIEKFRWDEVVLKPGSKIAGAFHDPNISDTSRKPSLHGIPADAYEQFLEKCRNLSIPIQEIDAIWK